MAPSDTSNTKNMRLVASASTACCDLGRRGTTMAVLIAQPASAIAQHPNIATIPHGLTHCTTRLVRHPTSS